MVPDEILIDLQAKGLLSPEQTAAVGNYEHTRPFSLHYELRTLLYSGIVLLSGGLGVLLYQHLDDIGHGVLVAAITALMAACFAYAVRHQSPFTWEQAPRAGVVPDYLLLLGCLLFLTLEGYLQAQYELFGTRYGLAVCIPAALFFWLAYRFDHRGVLSMAITALASWIGLSIAPLSAFTENNFFRSGLGGAAVLLGLALMGAGFVSEQRNLKRHFAFTYLSLGSNLALIAATAALLSSEPTLLGTIAAPLVLLLSGFLIWYARRTHSYLFLLMGAVYGYIAFTYLFFKLFDSSSELLTLYFPFTTFVIILLFVKAKEIVGKP
ncbi:DUF2157 domain-containing protein [Hymenobacter sp. BT491]|uniref:DUF2157 domain-containing protein n=1 Tax=Hymenobacter sp. BT491 TaxID=2766779 RepID=UPI001653C063|nr:DUF2157 domain-containing protein [Hymenobacter sp. BT491]MBC6991383.1 DUF2157 domain-containing protein [Hymenobacter sp. BT491]